MDTVWILTEQQDYESEDTIGVYRDKPSVQELLDILIRQYGYLGVADGHLAYLATELHTNDVVRVWDRDTFHVSEWEVK